MSANRDDVLLQRLQSTIDSWSSEVTSAQEGLARQIGDARKQLGTLIDTLNRRSKPSNGNGADTLRSRALSERDSALQDAMQRNRDLEESIHQLQDERRALLHEVEVSLSEREDLRGQIAAHQEQEAAAAKYIEKAERELATLRRSMDTASATRASSDAEIARFKDAIAAAKAERDAVSEELARVQAELKKNAAETDQHRLEVESLTAVIQRLEDEAAEGDRANDGRVRELTAELAAAERIIGDHQDRLARLTDDRARLTEQVATLDTELDAAAARFERQEAAGREALAELEELRSAREQQVRAEAALREELESARSVAETLRRAEHELRDELASLNHQYERQRAKLAETEHELEAHWDLSKQANQRDESQRQDLAALRRELDDAREMVSQMKRDIEAARPADTGAWQLESRLTEMTRENDELRRLLDAAESRAQSAAPQDDLAIDSVREELLAFEQLLIEREEAVEAAAVRMQKLEETALRVQAEVAALRAGGSAPSPSLEEIDRLRARLQRLETANAEQSARIVEQDVELSQRRDEVAALQRAVQELELAPAETEEEPPRLVPSAAFAAHDATGQKKSMGEILVDAGIITGNQLASALDEQRTAKKRRLGSILVEKGLIREEIVAQVVASQLKLPFVRLSETKIHRSAVALLDGRLATHHMCFPVAATSAEIVVAMANPLDLIAIEDLEFASHLKVRPVVATLSDITSAIVEYYGVTIANAIAEDTFDVQTPPRIPTQQRPQR